MKRNRYCNPSRITLEGDQLYFTVNGQKQKAEDVKYIPADNLERLCAHARSQLESGVSAILLDGSISPPDKRRRQAEKYLRRFDASHRNIQELLTGS